MARTTAQHSHTRHSARGMRWMSERQLDAYLQAKEALRRLRAPTPPGAPRPTPPDQTV